MEAEALPPAASMQSTSASPSVLNVGHNPGQDSSDPVSPATSTRSLKRSADMLNDDDERQDNKRKRLSDEEKETETPGASTSTVQGSAGAAMDGPDASKLVEEMGLELSCGCCTEMCYNPIIVLPCQHYYCGSCYTLWTQNGGTNCPSCRSPVSSIVPSRAIQSLIEAYLRAVPSRARTTREKEQADEIYTAGNNINVPTPRPRSPDIAPPQDNDAYHRPCPHCSPTNDFNWSCPEPIIDPAVDINRAKLISDGIPTGHVRCGSCEHIHATRAPSTSRCDFCSQSFCGLVVPTRCHAKRIREQRPIGMDNLMDILGNGEVYDAFGINAIEFDYMLDYLRERDLSPRSIYTGIVEPLAASNDGWRPLLDMGMFPEVNARIAASATQDPPPANTQQATDEQTPESPARTPETAVDVPAPAEPQPPSSDSDMRPSEDIVNSNIAETNPLGSQPENTAATSSETPQVPDSEVPTTANPDTVMEDATTAAPPIMEEATIAAPLVAEEAAIAVLPVMEEATIAAPSVVEEAAIAAPSEERPPTPLAVPEREHTPPIPEPTLDALPMDFEPPQNTQQATEPVAGSAPEPAAEAPGSTDQGVVIVASEDDGSSQSSEVGDNDEPIISPPSSPVPPGNVPTPRLQLSRICRTCAAEVFFWGARNWWIKERAKAVQSGELAEDVRKRKDCENIGSCEQEFDNAHAREFNHIPKPPPSENTSQENAAAAPTNPPEEPSQTTGNSDAQNNAGAPAQTNDGTNTAPEEPEQPSPAANENNEMNVDPPVPAPASEPAVPTPGATPTATNEQTQEQAAASQVDSIVIPEIVREAGSTTDSQQSSHSSQSSEEPGMRSPESSQGSFVSPLVDIISPVLDATSESQTQTQGLGQSQGQSQKDEHVLLSPNGDVHMAEAEQNGLPISSATVSSATTRVV